MDSIEGFRLLACDARAPLRDDAQPRLLDHGIDRAGEIARGGIGFDDGKGTLDRHRKLSLRADNCHSSRRLIAAPSYCGKACARRSTAAFGRQMNG